MTMSRTELTAPPRQSPPFGPRSEVNERFVELARSVVAELFGSPAERAFAVRYWTGLVEEPRATAPRFTMVIRRPGALRRILLPPSELALAEAYLRDDLDVEGDLVAASTIGDHLAERLRSPAILARLARTLLELPSDDLPREEVDRKWSGVPLLGRLHLPRRDREAVRFHYDVGNDFYQLWLDERMQYSCAYFPTGAETIDEAQQAKLEHICRKLRLHPGDRLLDIGCGWGGLIQYAAERYGVNALGITLSVRQAELARERLAAAGLADRCRVELRDYRELTPRDEFDKVVSVGMREHVGRARIADYFAAASRVLRPGGLFLDHGITRGRQAVWSGVASWAKRRLWRRDAFVRRYVFPDGELMPLDVLIREGEGAGLEAGDVENLREHYALTLRHWVRRLESAHQRAAELVGERTYRVWRLYMAATVVGFTTGRLTLIQTLYAKPRADGSTGAPLTRADLYA